MRWISLILVGLLFAGMLACQWEPPRRLPVTHRERWVRTVDGWELASSLAPPPPRYLPPLHPLVIASGQLLLVVGAFVLFPPKNPTPATDSPATL